MPIYCDVRNKHYNNKKVINSLEQTALLLFPHVEILYNLETISCKYMKVKGSAGSRVMPVWKQHFVDNNKSDSG